MNYPLKPNFRAKELLIPLLAKVYALEEENADFSVHSRKFHIALSTLTELMKKKSILREDIKISRDRLEKLRATYGQVRADRKIFEEHNPRPKPRRILFIRVMGKEEREYDERIASLEEKVESARLKVQSAEEEHKKLSKELDGINADYEKQQMAVDELRNKLVKSGIVNMLSGVGVGEIEEFTRAFLDTRALARGDKRVHIARIITEAILENPHHGFAIFGEVKEIFLPETSAEYRLVDNFLHFLNGSEISQRQLGVFLPSHFSYQENYFLYLFLEVVNGVMREEVSSAKEGYLMLLHLLHAWRSGEEVKVEEGALSVNPSSDPLTAEMLLYTLTAQNKEEYALKLVGVNTDSFNGIDSHAKIPENLRLTLMKLSEMRVKVEKCYAGTLERLFAHILVALKRKAPLPVFELAKEILQPRISGVLNVYLVKECYSGAPPIVNKKNPAELYWLA